MPSGHCGLLDSPKIEARKDAAAAEWLTNLLVQNPDGLTLGEVRSFAEGYTDYDELSEYLYSVEWDRVERVARLMEFRFIPMWRLPHNHPLLARRPAI